MDVQTEIARHLGLDAARATRFWSDFHVVTVRRRLVTLERQVEVADVAAGARVPLVGISTRRGNLVVLQAADLAEAARLVLTALARL